MGVIPGNENFADVKRDYGLEKVRRLTENIDANGSGTQTGSYYKPGNVRSIQVMITDAGARYSAAGFNILVKDSAGHTSRIYVPGQSITQDGDVGGDGVAHPMEDTALGQVSGSIIPHEFAIQNIQVGSSGAGYDIDVAILLVY